jgi:plastocyanin
MKRRLCYLVALLAGVLLLVPIAIAQERDQSVQAVPIQNVASVDIKDGSFDVADIAVEPGTTVYWYNAGEVPNTVTADDGSFDSRTLEPGDSHIVTFLGSGVVPYHSELHPEMVGSITVGGDSREGEAAPTGEDAPTREDAPTSEDAPTREDAPDEPVSYDTDTNENVLKSTI